MICVRKRNVDAALDAAASGCSGPRRMWRHIPKITVLSAIGLMMLIFYVTQWNRTPAPSGKAVPTVVYINQGVGTETSPAPSP